ncbi:ribosomal protein S18-alanine N-acetyltransferase [Microbacterium radiodurans]|uniref:Ribosomal-protein-alanine N-acetyltransferase n=1 Tax=Microbacterium radiodurans TaxID=661398 RepID=A0A5J5IMK7_9MICO|nr:ribosomal protein S18-alanine N-acetyltransferase [Microbacterium radiodurans]KAA9084070.1 ribosomal-protein-alanine N-acetyltransferase [Microbacterium radiodurans]
MTQRTATRDDLDAIMDLERAAFPTDAWSRAAMAAELASPHGRYLVDEEDGRVVGYGGVRAVRGASDADIQTIALDPHVRGTGRGRALLRALLAEARERGAREMFLEVRADNPVASGLYLSEGFVEIARRPRYYQPDDVDAIIMQRSLTERPQDGAAVAAHDAREPLASAENVPTAGEESR